MVMDILLKQLIIQPNAVSKTPTETEHLKAFMVINLSKLQIFLRVSWSNFNEYLIQMCMLQYDIALYIQYWALDWFLYDLLVLFYAHLWPNECPSRHFYLLWQKKRAAEDEIYINIFRFCSRIHEKFLQIANLLLWSWKVCLQEKEREGRARRGQWCDHITLRDEWFSCYLLIFNYSISRTILASINWSSEAESRVKHEQMRDFWAHIAGECACMCMDYA